MDMHRVYRFAANAQFFDFAAHSFIIDLHTRSLYNLGISSALIAAHLDGERDLKEIAAIVRAHYDASEAESTAAVMKFIGMMEQKQLIEELS